jgi:hypothetical protein
MFNHLVTSCSEILIPNNKPVSRFTTFTVQLLVYSNNECVSSLLTITVELYFFTNYSIIQLNLKPPI